MLITTLSHNKNIKYIYRLSRLGNATLGDTQE